jgi:hypothetical protein
VKILPHAVELKTVLLTIFNVDNASDVKASIFPVLSQVNIEDESLFFDIISVNLVNGIKCWFIRYAKRNRKNGDDIFRSNRSSKFENNRNKLVADR